MEKTYTKLGNLIDDKFTVEEAYGFTWKMWSPDTKRMLTSDQYLEGYRKIYSVKTNKGILDLGPGQLSTLLEAVYYKGKADIIGKTFKVKSNGKSGTDIRYFFNVVKDAPLPEHKVLETVLTAEEYDQAEPISLSNIPF